MSFSARLIEEIKCVIQRQIKLENETCHSARNELEKLNVSFSVNLIGEMKCVMQRKLTGENEMCHST